MFTQFLKFVFTFFKRSKFTFLVEIKKYFFASHFFQALKLTKKKQLFYLLVYF